MRRVEGCVERLRFVLAGAPMCSVECPPPRRLPQFFQTFHTLQPTLASDRTVQFFANTSLYLLPTLCFTFPNSLLIIGMPGTGTHYTFIREIPIFARYELRMRVVGWGDKWVRTFIFSCFSPGALVSFWSTYRAEFGSHIRPPNFALPTLRPLLKCIHLDEH